MNTWPVREADKHDWPVIQKFFKSLDADSRYMYFGAHVSDQVIDQVWDRFSLHEHKFFVVELSCAIVGVCQVAHRGDQAELSVAVATKQRNRGIAHALVERAVSWCKTHDIHDLMMFCLPDNDVIPKILKRHNLLPLMLSKPAEARFVVPEPNAQDWKNEYQHRITNWWLNYIRKFLFGWMSSSQKS